MGKIAFHSRPARKIKTLADLNIYSYKSIAEIAEVSKKCVFTTLHNFEATGSFEENHRSGAPRKSTDREDKRLFTLVRANPKASLRDLSSAWQRDQQPIASLETVRSRVHEFGLESHVAAVKPALTDRHKANRLKWCEERVDWSFGKWADIVFSDESNYK